MAAFVTTQVGICLYATWWVLRQTRENNQAARDGREAVNMSLRPWRKAVSPYVRRSER